MTGYIIAAVGAALSALTFIIGRTTAAKADGRQTGAIMSELGYLKSNTDDIKLRLDRQDEREREYIARLTAVEASERQVQRRLDLVESMRTASC